MKKRYFILMMSIGFLLLCMYLFLPGSPGGRFWIERPLFTYWGNLDGWYWQRSSYTDYYGNILLFDEPSNTTVLISNIEQLHRLGGTEALFRIAFDNGFELDLKKPENVFYSISTNGIECEIDLEPGRTVQAESDFNDMFYKEINLNDFIDDHFECMNNTPRRK